MRERNRDLLNMSAGMLKKLFIYMVFAAILGTPAIVWFSSVNSPLAYLSHSLPPGQLLYVAAKLLGLLALSTFWVQCLLGLARHAPALKGFPTVGGRVHRYLGLVVVLLVFAHVSMFVIAASMRAGAPAWNLLWPDFSHGYYGSFVSLGLIGVWLLLFVAYAGWKTSRGQRRWKKAHMLWFVVFAFAFLHAYAIGSESRYGAMRYVLLFMATSLVAASASRMLKAWKSRGAPARGNIEVPAEQGTGQS